MSSSRIISGSLMQVGTGQVYNRQVADLVGVNILWDAEMNSAGHRLFFCALSVSY